MPDDLLVETNWILDVAWGQHRGAGRLWQLAEQHRLNLHLPDTCMMESLKVLEDRQRVWQRMTQDVRTNVGQFRRSTSFILDFIPFDDVSKTLDQMKDHAAQLLWTALENIARAANLIPVDYDIVRRTTEIRTALAITPADAIVFATVVETSERGICRNFMSRDKDIYGTTAAQQLMAAYSITYYADPTDYLRTADLR